MDSGHYAELERTLASLKVSTEGCRVVIECESEDFAADFAKAVALQIQGQIMAAGIGAAGEDDP